MGASHKSLMSAAMVAAIGVSGTSAAQQRLFDLPAQSATKAIPEFGRQAGVQIIAPGVKLRHLRTPQIKGHYDTRQALRTLLKGSGLDVVADDGATITLASLAAPARQDALPARAQDATPPTTPPVTGGPEAAQQAPSPSDPVVADIVVRGIRQSLEAAAAIKRNSANIVDSIVAEDIGKLPDLTTASALQRVPGVQVVVASNNEISGPIIRGLGDISSTVNGREIFTGVGRTFAFQDLPAEALAGADVYKSNTANLLEGGVAGTVDLRLHRAFDFKKFTVAGIARATYGQEAGVKDRVDPTAGLLIADRWDTGIGEIGALLDVSYLRMHYARPIAFNDFIRSGNHGPPGIAGIQIPTGFGSQTEYGEYQRPQANFSLQWQAAPELQLYVEGLYAGYRSNNAIGQTLYDNFSSSGFTNVKIGTECLNYAVGSNGYTNATGAIENLCDGQSFTVSNPYGVVISAGRHAETDTSVIAGGYQYRRGPFALAGDVSYEDSTNAFDSFAVTIGKRVAQTTQYRDVDHSVVVDVPGAPLMDSAGLAFTNALNEQHDRSSGQLFASKTDAVYDVGGLLKNIQAGIRTARRTASFRQYIGATAAPGGNYATLVANAGLPSGFLVPGPGVPHRNDGNALNPDPDFLRGAQGEAQIRQLYGLPPGVPAFQDNRNYRATERTYAGYLQAAYQFALGSTIDVDGLLGSRLTRTDRDISGAGLVTNPTTKVTTAVPVSASTSDTDLLPNASVRLRIGAKFQTRFNYARTLFRPDFASLNPGINYVRSFITTVLNTGTAGNPNLKPEKADSFDATVEYYFSRQSYVAAGVYKKNITDRLVQNTTTEVIDGVSYAITRPRNLGSATLKGIEMSGQVFLDFLPGLLSGFGVSGNFTLADSKVTTKGDRLEGLPLFGVSKYNFNTALIYEKHRVSARAIYTYRSSYGDGDATGTQQLRPVGTVVLIRGVRAGGRLDANINYDVLPSVTLSLSGTNLAHNRYRSFLRVDTNPRDYRVDDTTYAVGARFRF